MPTDPPPEIATFRDLRWKTRWLVMGGAFLALWYSTRFLDREWISSYPAWIMLVLTCVVPQVFLLLFPIFTRDRQHVRRIRLPKIRQCLKELAIAIPIVIVTVIVLSGLDYVVGQLWPGKTLRPDAIDNMAASPTPGLVYLLLLFSFTFAPMAEEVFFRGFIYNAFRRRMPKLIAGVIQSLIFGMIHFFGTTHAMIAFGLGIVITLVYEWRKTLAAPIFVHAGINLISALGVMVLMAEHAKQPAIGVVGGHGEEQCVVREIVPGSAASESDIEIGDIITALDGEPVANFQELASAVSTRQPGDAITLSIIRSGANVYAEVTLKRRGDSTPPKQSLE